MAKRKTAKTAKKKRTKPATKPAAATAAPPPIHPRRSTAEEVDRELAAEAIRKRQTGETPTARETAALGRIEKAAEEQARWDHYRTIPQKHILQLTGWQTKNLQDVQRRYGLPVAGRETDLERFFPALRDLLKAFSKLKPQEEEKRDPEALERLRGVKIRLAELELARLQGGMVSLEEVHAAFSLMGMMLRNAGTVIEKMSPESAQVLRETWDDCERELGLLGNANVS